jgi:hypothetical protein
MSDIFELIRWSLVRRHSWHSLSLRFARNHSGFSEGFPIPKAFGRNDISVSLLIAVLAIFGLMMRQSVDRREEI